VAVAVAATVAACRQSLMSLQIAPTDTCSVPWGLRTRLTALLAMSSRKSLRAPSAGSVVRSYPTAKVSNTKLAAAAAR
jgi:hypothetical protein